MSCSISLLGVGGGQGTVFSAPEKPRLFVRVVPASAGGLGGISLLQANRCKTLKRSDGTDGVEAECDCFSEEIVASGLR